MKRGFSFCDWFPMAIPYVLTARVHGMRILRHKMTQIVDALKPDGRKAKSVAGHALANPAPISRQSK